MKLRIALALLSFAAVLDPAPAVRAQNPQRSDEQRLRVLVPAYFYPVPGSPWTRLSAAAARHPALIWAIGDPANGPGAAIDPSYSAAFADFRAHHGRLLGYVYTSYGARPLAQVTADIDRWLAWYPLDGFFVDEMDNVPGAHESYYHALWQHVSTAKPGAPVVANPGTSSSLDYLDGAFGRCASTLCLYENSTGFLSYAPDPWMLTRPRREFYALPYATAAAAWKTVVHHAFDAHFGWVYATDDVLPNPWDTLPSYFEALVDYVEAPF